MPVLSQPQATVTGGVRQACSAPFRSAAPTLVAQVVWGWLRREQRSAHQRSRFRGGARGLAGDEQGTPRRDSARPARQRAQVGASSGGITCRPARPSSQCGRGGGRGGGGASGDPGPRPSGVGRWRAARRLYQIGDVAAVAELVVAGAIHPRSFLNLVNLSGSPGALPRRGPLRTGRAGFPRTSAQASPVGVAGDGAGFLRWRARRRRWQEVCVRRVRFPSDASPCPWWVRYSAAIALRTMLSHQRSQSWGDCGGWSGVIRWSPQSGQRPSCLASRRRL